MKLFNFKLENVIESKETTYFENIIVRKGLCEVTNLYSIDEMKKRGFIEIIGSVEKFLQEREFAIKIKSEEERLIREKSKRRGTDRKRLRQENLEQENSEQENLEKRKLEPKKIRKFKKFTKPKKSKTKFNIKHDKSKTRT